VIHVAFDGQSYAYGWEQEGGIQIKGNGRITRTTDNAEYTLRHTNSAPLSVPSQPT
jgi:hypothetical protein